MVTLNGEMLSKIGSSSESAQIVMNTLAKRERFRRESDLTRLKRDLIKQGSKVVDEDYMQFWKGLEAEGVGSIIHGRKGKSDRFKWNYSLKVVADAAKLGSAQEVPELSNKPITKAPANRVKGRPIGSVNRGRLFNLPITLTVTKEELKAIVKVLKSA